MELCQSDAAGMKELLSLVIQDAGMSARLLALANSSAYRRAGPVATLESALQTIGTEMIRIIVINESVAQVFDKMAQARNVDLRNFWWHALQAGLTARIVAQKTGYPNSEEAYLAGLLHDVGRLAMLAVLPREYGYNFYAADNDDLCAIEERTMQITHAEVGSLLINQWQLDSFIADSVLYHHETPLRLNNAHPLVRIVHLADAINGDMTDRDLEKSGTLCALSLADLHEVSQAATEQVQIAAKCLNLDLGAASQPVHPLSGAADPAQEKMMEQVRSMMLASALDRTFTQQKSEGDLAESISRSARILFHFDCAVLLTLNASGDALVGSDSGEHRGRLAGFKLPLDLEGSAIASAALSHTITCTPTVSAATPVLEEQLLRLFATDHLACMPLVIDGQCAAVLIGGFKDWQSDDLMRRTVFLGAFSHQAALAIRNRALQNEEQEQLIKNMAQGYREASRKVAHEINNPLSIIKNYLSILDRKILNMQAISGEVAVLNEEIDRVGKIVEDFAEMTPTGQTARIDVRGIAEEVVRLFRQAEYGSSALIIENRIENRPLEIDASADTLKQILINLVKNAAEAMRDGGLLEIGSDGLVNRDGILYVCLWVRDNGPGIAPEIMSRLFAPVESTKGKGHSGLGLNIVHGLVKKMHGKISCRSTAAGSTFEILLPQTRSVAASQITASQT